LINKIKTDYIAINPINGLIAISYNEN